MSSRPETGVSKAHGGISVLLNFTDFPSPLYRFIALEGRSLVSPSNDGHCRVAYLWRIYLASLLRETLYACISPIERMEIPSIDPVENRNVCSPTVIIYYTHALPE